MYAYTCTCIDYALHSTGCKHIHFVHMAIPSQRTAIKPTSDSTPVAGGILEHIVQTTPTSRATNLQQCVLSKAQEVIALAKVTNNTDALEAAAKHLGNAISALKSITVALQTLPCRKRPAANAAHMDHQFHFHSTMKKKKTTTPYRSLLLWIHSTRMTSSKVLKPSYAQFASKPSEPVEPVEPVES